MGRPARGERHLGGRLKVLDPRCDIEGFFARLAGARERVLLLDYDGTLAPFHADPQQALPYPGLRDVLGRIAAAPRNRIVIVSGRRLEDLRGPIEMLAHHEAWASHGWERLADGRVHRRIPTPRTQEALDRAKAAIQPLLVTGVRAEVKVASVALHWRGTPPELAHRTRAAALEAWEALEGEELALLPFEQGLEIRGRGHDKGDAVRAALARPGDVACAYLGDDVTDEDAFRAIRPHGLAVLVGDELRGTEAQLWLRPPAELLEFLERWPA